MWHVRERKVYKTMAEKTEGNRLNRRPRGRCEDGIRMDIVEIGWGGGVQSGLKWLRIRASGGLL
jgi:hypothetical protein